MNLIFCSVAVVLNTKGKRNVFHQLLKIKSQLPSFPIFRDPGILSNSPLLHSAATLEYPLHGTVELSSSPV